MPREHNANKQMKTKKLGFNWKFTQESMQKQGQMGRIGEGCGKQSLWLEPSITYHPGWVEITAGALHQHHRMSTDYCGTGAEEKHSEKTALQTDVPVKEEVITIKPKHTTIRMSMVVWIEENRVIHRVKHLLIQGESGTEYRQQQPLDFTCTRSYVKDVDQAEKESNAWKSSLRGGI